MKLFEQNEEPNEAQMLNALIDDYQMSPDALAQLLQIPREALESIREGNEFALPSDCDKRFAFVSQLALLCHADDKPDFKVAAFLTVLLELHGLSPACIAAFAGCSPDDITIFLKKPEDVPLSVRYQIASVVMSLRFFFKEAEPSL